jgi:hypothetical protein
MDADNEMRIVALTGRVLWVELVVVRESCLAVALAFIIE